MTPDYKKLYEDLKADYLQLLEGLQLEGLAIQNSAVNKRQTLLKS